MNKALPRVRSLPPSEWPEPDRLAWAAARQPGERLRRGGAASHLKPITQADLARRYGYFLDHLQRHGLPLSSGAPADMVVPEHVHSYVVEMRGRVGSVTVYGSIYKLRRAAELMAPSRDFQWLRSIENDLDLMKVPRSKHSRLVLSVPLVKAGMAAAEKAEQLASVPDNRSHRLQRRATLRRALGAADQRALNQAIAARDALMVALLALCPIRAKNFAALELGVSFCRIGASWWIVLPNADTKAGRWDERPVPSMLTPMIERYVGHHRLILGRHRADPEAGPLWVSGRGGPITASAVDQAIRRTTRAGVGVALGPHMFRTAAATEVAVRAPENSGLASALLQHRDPRVTEAHYNRATSHQAAQEFEKVLQTLCSWSMDRHPRTPATCRKRNTRS